EAGTYYVVDKMPDSSWFQTGGGDTSNGSGSDYWTVASSGTNVTGKDFANMHLGQNQGLTIGYYSNKNGQKTITADDLTYLRSLNLRNADGSVFDPTTAAQVSAYLLGANATNMANMLSAQLIATALNVRHGLVTSAAVYVGGTQMGAFNTFASSTKLITALDSKPTDLTNGAGCVSISGLIAAANNELALYGVSTASVNSGERAYMEAMKDVLDA